MKTECDYLNGWIKKKTKPVTYAKISSKGVNLREIAGECWRKRRKWSGNFPPLLLYPSFFPSRLDSLMVKASASGAEGPGFQSRLRRDFSGSSHTSDFKIGTPVATLPGAWRYGVSAGTGWPGVSILWLGEVESCICNFYLSVAAGKIVCADPTWDTLACCWDVKQPTNKATNLFSLSLSFFLSVCVPSCCCRVSLAFKMNLRRILLQHC